MRRLIVLATAFVSLAAAGCGGTTSPGTLLASAITKAGEEESYRGTFSMKSDLGGQPFEMTGEQISNADSTRGRGSFDLTIDGEQLPMDVVILEDELWIGGEGIRAALPDGKTWVLSKDPMLTQQSMTPAQLVDLMKDTKTVEDLGTAKVNGVETRRLRGPVEVSEMLERTGGPLAAAAKDSPELDKLTAIMDVWIEPENEQLRRVEVVLSAAGESGSMRVRADILETGVSLAGVKAPPADQVAPEDVLDEGGSSKS